MFSAITSCGMRRYFHGHFEAVIVMAPFAAGEHLLGNLLHGQIRKAFGHVPGPPTRKAAQSTSNERSGPTSSLNCASWFALRCCVVT